MSGYYKEGLNRKQQLLLPPSLDEYVSEDNPVRAVDAYVALLDWSELGFADTRKSSRTDGQKAYHPTLLLKIYLYGYLNKVRSSRAHRSSLETRQPASIFIFGFGPVLPPHLTQYELYEQR